MKKRLIMASLFMAFSLTSVMQAAHFGLWDSIKHMKEHPVRNGLLIAGSIGSVYLALKNPDSLACGVSAYGIGLVSFLGLLQSIAREYCDHKCTASIPLIQDRPSRDTWELLVGLLTAGTLA